MKIAAIIVAAGRSSRFAVEHNRGTNKLLADLDGRPIIAHVAGTIAAAALNDAVLVTAPNGDEIARAAGDGVRHIINDRPAEGLSSSIQAGLASLAPSIDGALVVLADMPRVTGAMIGALRAAFIGSGGSKIVFPQAADGRQGNPVLWPRSLFADLNQLSGDVGGKAILVRYPTLHCPVAIEDASALSDIDTPDDLARVTALKT
jgi:molybdenum cofactor cytidylyltransferase